MKTAPALCIRFWGVRGSYAVPGRSTVRVGGNSSCVEVVAAGRTLVFDAGTGIIGLGWDLVRRRGSRAVDLFLSHLHHDHIEGLRFFQPLYRADWRCDIYGPGSGAHTLDGLLHGTMASHLFPVSFEELPGKVTLHHLEKRARVALKGSSGVTVTARHSKAHPRTGIMLYRVTCAGRSVVYATDIEGPKGGYEDVVEFARGADVLIHDAQYTTEEYYEAQFNKAGWGHSTVALAAETARAAGVGELLLYHHDPLRDDGGVSRLERLARGMFPRTRAAREGMKIELGAPKPPPPRL